jgi:ferredoxin-type protein NapH
MLRTVRRQRIRKGLLFTSFLLFPIGMNYFSPYVIIDSALVGIMNGSFIVFTLLFISSLFSCCGFCDWLCPAGGGRGDWAKYACWTPCA